FGQLCLTRFQRRDCIRHAFELLLLPRSQASGAVLSFARSLGGAIFCGLSGACSLGSGRACFRGLTVSSLGRCATLREAFVVAAHIFAPMSVSFKCKGLGDDVV